MRFLCDYLGRLGALLVLPEKNEYEPRAAAAARTFPPGVTPSAGLERATLFRSFRNQYAVSAG
jgi:hypothetical protein